MFSFARALSLGLVALPFATAAVYDVQVGANGQLAFSPEAIPAQPGDQVVFHFNPKNHTVTQSSFANPCGQKPGGFDSGFEPIMANQTQPTFAITVNDTQPIWVYCRQTGHCGQGMVFAVNCGADGSQNSFTNFKNAALAQGAAGYPGSYPTPTTTGSVAPTPSATTGPQVFNVIVGGPNGLVFTPSSIAAQPNDIVTFEFHQKNHTVTQSSFASPCSRLNANGITGFDSGFFPVGANDTQFPTWNYTVQDTKPVWAYCRQGNHCQSGMVFAINANENSAQNFTAFVNNAKSSATSTSTTSASTPSSTHASSAVSIRLGGTSATLMVVALLSLVL
jgi:plastocyanin